MLILPAIDILDQKAVRLYKGRYDQVTVYGEPCEIAKKMKSEYAEKLHLVDLDGARAGRICAFKEIERIISLTGLRAEVGGGIRDLESVEKYLGIGVENVILGTAAVNNKQLLAECIKRYGDKITVGADILDGKIRTAGWLEYSKEDYKEFIKQMSDMGIKRIICTDISKDGAMSGTNLDLYRELAGQSDILITASGGISGIEEIKKLKEIGIDSAIIGKAYYTGAIDLKQAIEVAR